MSSIWEFFTKTTPTSSRCNLCSKSYSTCGNSTNAKNHIMRKHKDAYNTFKSSANGESYSRGRKRNQDSEEIDDTDSCVDLTRQGSKGHGSHGTTSSSKLSSMSSTTGNRVSSKSHGPPPSKKQTTLSDCIDKRLSIEVGGQKNNDMTQALIYMICRDNLPFSCVEKEGLQHYTRVAQPRYKLPSRWKVTSLVEQRYSTTRAILKNVLGKAEYVALTSDILTLTNSTRSFLVVTAHYLNPDSTKLESFGLAARRLCESHTAIHIAEQFDIITSEWSIVKDKIISITTDGGSNMVNAVNLFLGQDMAIRCMAHLINLLVNDGLKDVEQFGKLCTHIKSIVKYFKQSTNAMDMLRKEQEGMGKKEGDVLVLIQSVDTRWNSNLDMIERFNVLSNIVGKILASQPRSARSNIPDMVPSSQLGTLQTFIDLLKPFKDATVDISGDKYVTAGLAISMTNLLEQEVREVSTSSQAGADLKKSLLSGITNRLRPLEKNRFLAIACLLDPRFKKIHFGSPMAVAGAVELLSNEIRAEYRRRGLTPSNPNPSSSSVPSEKPKTSGLWARHEKIVSTATATANPPAHGVIPVELKQYFDQANAERLTDPLKWWLHAKQFTPVLASIALKYFICPASSVPSERLASTVNLVVPDNRSRLTGEHVDQRTVLSSVPDKYWFN